MNQTRGIGVGILCLAIASAGCAGQSSNATGNGANGTSGGSGANGNAGNDGSSGTSGAAGSPGSDGQTSLVATAKTAPNAMCPQGGITIQSGVDSNANGQLDQSEVVTSQELCSSDLLTSSSTLAVGDPNCTYGGTQVLLGLDNGAGGGIAGDGTLQTGEVQSTQINCALGPQLSGVLTPPPAGSNSFLSAYGGGNISQGPMASTGVNGGNGGNVDITLGGSGGGHIKIFNSGLATNEAALPQPPTVAANPGSHPFTVATSVNIAALTTASAQGASGAAEQLFTLTDEKPVGAVYYKGPTGLVEVTSLTVPTGASVGIAKNNGNIAQASFPGEVVNNGVIVSAAIGVDVALGCSSYRSGPSGYLGALIGKTTLSAVGTIYNAGRLTAAGEFGYASAMASGFPLTISSAYGVIYNSGTITARASMPGYSAGPITLTAALGIYNSSTITASVVGASGAQAATGGDISLSVGGQPNNGGVMQIRNTGTIDSSSQPCLTVDGCTAGGSGGNISLTVHGGPLVKGGYIAIASAGQLLANGGDGANSRNAAGTRGKGGNGGNITITSDDKAGVDAFGNVDTVAGSIYLSNDISSRGGYSAAFNANAGNAGNIAINVQSSLGNGQEIVLLGYTSVQTFGGDGGTAASFRNSGNGGNITIKNTGAGGGGVINYAHLLASGGGSASGLEGTGGDLLISSTSGTPAAAVNPNQFVINNANIILNGGSNFGQVVGSEGNFGGKFEIYGAASVHTQGNIFAIDGIGAKLPVAPTGARASIIASGGGTVSVAGNIDVTAGSSATAGFPALSAQSVTLSGQTVQCLNTSITANGGTAAADLGGNGGNIALISTAGSTDRTGSTFSTTGGLSGPAKAITTPGVVIVDGVVLAP